MIENRAKEVIGLVSSIQDFFHNMTAEMITKQISAEEKKELDRLYAELLRFKSDATVFALTTKVIMKDHKHTKDEITKHTTAIRHLRQRVMTLQIELFNFGSQRKRQGIEYNVQQVVLFCQFAGFAFPILAICSVFEDTILSYCCCCCSETSGCAKARLNQCLGRFIQVSSFLTAAIFIMLAWHFANIDWKTLLEPMTKYEHLEQTQYEDFTPIHEAFTGLGAILAGESAEDMHKFESEIVKLCDIIIEHAKMKVR